MFPEPSVRARLLQLKAQSSELADRLDADAGNLESRGTPPTQHLIDDLATFRRQLLELARIVHPDAEDDDDRSLIDIGANIRQAAESQPAVRELDRFLSLTTSGPELPALIEHQSRAKELRAAILEATDDSILSDRDASPKGNIPGHAWPVSSLNRNLSRMTTGPHGPKRSVTNSGRQSPGPRPEGSSYPMRHRLLEAALHTLLLLPLRPSPPKFVLLPTPA